ncbi:uncharacterized protein [Tiliqua scincoides]|uniref:uncharacterized protein isoform X2 n=1 Tax=Tiliqua scincoides TaxID=71010 RepID=UPI003462419A
MALPAIHKCLRLNQENQELLKKLRHARLRNKQLEYDLAHMQDQLHGQKKLMPTKKDVLVQTEMRLCERGDGSNYKGHEIATENARVLQMYKNLQKKYNKGLKTNQEQNGTIATLSSKINELECQLKVANQKMKELESKKISAKVNAVPGVKASAAQRKVSSYKCMCKRKGGCSCRYLDQLLFEVQHLKIENEKLSKERRMLRNELAALDKDFFDEIEDLKYALQEAMKLNNQYERFLKQLRSTYGITFTPN